MSSERKKTKTYRTSLVNNRKKLFRLKIHQLYQQIKFTKLFTLKIHQLYQQIKFTKLFTLKIHQLYQQIKFTKLFTLKIHQLYQQIKFTKLFKLEIHKLCQQISSISVHLIWPEYIFARHVWLSPTNRLLDMYTLAITTRFGCCFFVFFWLLNLELVVKSFVVPQRPSRLKDRRRMNLECFPPKWKLTGHCTVFRQFCAKSSQQRKCQGHALVSAAVSLTLHSSRFVLVTMML